MKPHMSLRGDVSVDVARALALYPNNLQKEPRVVEFPLRHDLTSGPAVQIVGLW